MNPSTAVKLRPGAHFVPTARGVRCAHGEVRLRLDGNPALWPLLDRTLDRLTDGTTVAELTAAVGPAGGRVLAGLVDTLMQHGVLLDLAAAGGPLPDSGTARRYADVLAHLEQHCARPYDAFARLRAATVWVTGTGTAAAAAARALQAAGVGSDAGRGSRQGTAACTVRVGDAAALQAVPWTGPTLPVACCVGTVAVGPVCDGPDDRAAFLNAVRRVAAWQRLLQAAPPRLLAQTLAGSLAGRRVVDHLAGTGQDDGGIVVVHGRGCDTSTVPLPAAGRMADDAALTAPWRGLGRPPVHRGEDHPIATAVLEPVDPAGAPHAGWGRSPEAARRQALLDLLRRRAGTATGVGVAARSADRFRLDAALRLRAARLPAAVPARERSWRDPALPAARRLWRALAEYYETPVRLLCRPLGAGTWTLATALPRHGAAPASQWGPTPEAATYAALGTVLCGLLTGTAGTGDTAGTWIVDVLDDAAVAAALTELRAGSDPEAVPGEPDPVLGALPYHSGRLPAGPSR